MRTELALSLRPLPPALIGAALDCLAHLPDGHQLDANVMVAVARAIGCHNSETSALLVRIRAAAIVMNDARWPAWPLSLKSASAEERQIFDAAMLKIIGALPLSSELTFSSDAFFEALLASVAPLGRA